MPSIDSTRALEVGASTRSRRTGHEDVRVAQIVLGSRLSRYVVLERLGEGGMGVVYSAFDPVCDRKIALKVLWPGSTDQIRLVREARAMARLSHPNAVQIYDVGDHEGRVFFAMELVEGATLGEWREKHSPSWREIVEVFVQAGRGLMAAHEAGLVHRDFKPSNVLVRNDGRVLVGDFGVAWAAASPPTPLPDSSGEMLSSSEELLEPDAMTGTGAVVGTPKYMAPEQHTGARTDERADQFAFCVSLYEALWGQSPYPHRSYGEVTTAKLGAPPRTPPAQPRVPAELWAIVQRGLAIAPDQRFADMGALIERLERTLRSGRRGPIIAAASVASIAALLIVIAPARGRTCGDSEPLWDASARAAVQHRFEKSGLAYASAAAQRVDQRLIEIAASWQRARADACDEGLLATSPTMRCLDRTRASASALVSALYDADATMIERAAAAVIALPDPALCRLDTDADALPDAGDGGEVADLRSRLAVGDATARLGRVEAARAEAEEVLARAQALDQAWLAAEAELALGRHAHLLGDDRAALAALQRAAWGGSASGNDRVAAEAAIALVEVTSAGRSDEGDPFSWARHAEAALARLPPAPILQADLARHLGTAREHRGDYDGAAADYRHALSLLDAVTPTPVLELAEVHSSLGNVAFHLGDYPAATAEHTQARALWEDTLGSEHPKVALALNGLGLDAYAMGEIDESLELHQHALAIRERALGTEHPDVAGSLVNLASVHLARGDLGPARERFARALAMKERTLGTNHPLLVATLSNLGAVEMAEGKYERARELFARAAAIIEAERGPDHPDLAVVLNNVGVALARSGDDKGAVAAYTRVYELERRVLGEDHPQLAGTHFNLAATMRKLGSLDEADRHYRRALVLFEGSEGARGPSTVRTLVGLGETALLRGDEIDASERFERALAASDEPGINPSDRRTDASTQRQALPSDGAAGVLRAQAEFGLARASRARGDHRRATALGIAARDRFATLAREDDRARVDAWLRE